MPKDGDYKKKKRPSKAQQLTRARTKADKEKATQRAEDIEHKKAHKEEAEFVKRFGESNKTFSLAKGIYDVMEYQFKLFDIHRLSIPPTVCPQPPTLKHVAVLTQMIRHALALLRCKHWLCVLPTRTADITRLWIEKKKKQRALVMAALSKPLVAAAAAPTPPEHKEPPLPKRTRIVRPRLLVFSL
jgi:hypothetical protein